MTTPRPVPLAWCNLTHDRVRFALFALGIAFAVVLMGVQMGIRNALVDSNCRVIDHLAVDLVLVHPHRMALLYRDGVSRRRLQQAVGVAGVASVHPLYVDYQLAELTHFDPVPGRRRPTRSIRVIGLDPDAGLFDLPELRPGSESAAALKAPDTALFDRRAKPDPARPGETVYGKPPTADERWGMTTEINSRRVTLVGGFDFGTDFAADGTLIVNEETFLDAIRAPVYPASPAAAVDLGLVRVARGADVVAVRDRLRAELAAGPDRADRDLDVLTLPEYRDREATFWLTMTPIGFAFNAGIALGFVVGLVICYQILASDVTDHLGEYATLRAIGYTNRFLSRVVLQEALILAAAGFVPGMLVTAGVSAALGHLTGLPVNLTPARVGWVLAATVGMCVGSGLLALRKAQTVDPANVF